MVDFPTPMVDFPTRMVNFLTLMVDFPTRMVDFPTPIRNKCRRHRKIRTKIPYRMVWSRKSQPLRRWFSWPFLNLCLGGTFGQLPGNFQATSGWLSGDFQITFRPLSDHFQTFVYFQTFVFVAKSTRRLKTYHPKFLTAWVPFQVLNLRYLLYDWFVTWLVCGAGTLCTKVCGSLLWVILSSMSIRVG